MISNKKKSILHTLWILIFFAMSSPMAFSQFYIEVYAGAAKYNKLNNINRALYKYNVTRDWLDKEMTGLNRKIHSGWEVVIGDPEKYMEFGITSYRMSTFANGPQPDLQNALGQKEVKISHGSLYYGIIYRLWESDMGKSEVIVGLAPALEMITSTVIYTADLTTNSNQEKEHTSYVGGGVRFSGSYKFFPTHWLGLVVKPSYHLTGKVLVNDIHNNILNITSVYPADLADKFSRFSLSVGLNISFGRY